MHDHNDHVGKRGKRLRLPAGGRRRRLDNDVSGGGAEGGQQFAGSRGLEQCGGSFGIAPEREYLEVARFGRALHCVLGRHLTSKHF